jgi:hypothetical protein
VSCDHHSSQVFVGWTQPLLFRIVSDFLDLTTVTTAVGTVQFDGVDIGTWVLAIGADVTSTCMSLTYTPTVDDFTAPGSIRLLILLTATTGTYQVYPIKIEVTDW